MDGAGVEAGVDPERVTFLDRPNASGKLWPTTHLRSASKTGLSGESVSPSI
jgi:hypothetical protein